MRAGFDPQIFCHQRFGGISRYFAALVRELAQLPDVDARIFAPYHFNEYLGQLPRPLVQGRRVAWLEGMTALSYGASLIPACVGARRFRPDIMHATYYFPARPPPRARSIVTVYDMIQEKYPHYTRASSLVARWKAACVARADHVICISENTRRDLLAAYAIDADRVSVTHLGCDPLDRLQRAESATAFRTRVLGADSPYLLYVGSRAAYKNFGRLLEAFAASAQLRADFSMVCFGGGAFTREEDANIARAGLQGRVVQRGGPDAELAACYAHAALFVCPSAYEGFGIPVLEAMSLDCPVACSNNSSLPEVVGDAAALFDPLDIASIRSALEGTLGSPAAVAALVARGRLRRQQFSWRRCAEQTLQVYRQVLSAGNPRSSGNP